MDGDREPPAADAIVIDRLGVTFGTREILREVSLRIEAGEFIGIFGPNGAGKSTLMRCLLGLLPPTTGSIRLFGKAPSEARESVGYMPQTAEGIERTALTPRALTAAVRRGTDWGLPWQSAAAREEVDSVLERAGASDYADQPLSVLSGGEKQRVALAQALLGNPRMLVLDEPLASLDPHHQSRLVETVASISREHRVTTLFIAHDINPLLGVMSRALYLAGGGAVLGSPDEVLTGETLSRLYGIPMKVLRTQGQIVILAGDRGIVETARHG